MAQGTVQIAQGLKEQLLEARRDVENGDAYMDSSYDTALTTQRAQAGYLAAIARCLLIVATPVVQEAFTDIGMRLSFEDPL